MEYFSGVKNAVKAATSKLAPVRPASQRARGVAWFVLLLFLVLTVWYSLTRGPWWDEGVFADVAVSFRNSGYLHSSVLAPFSYANLPAVDRYTYWQFPVYLLSLGEWFHLVPASAQWMRLFSVLWGCVYAACWLLLARALTRNETLAIWVACVVALDFSCLAAASDGRMDMMCAGLGEAALAAYVCLRAMHPKRGALLAGVFGAASLLCHPMGVVTNALLGVMLLIDRRRIRWSTLLLLALPYVLGGVLCLGYILQAPQIFLAQARDISGYRVDGLTGVLGNIASDLNRRYLEFYFAPHSGWHKLKIFSLLYGVVGLGALAVNKKFRSEPFVRILLVFFVVAYLGVAIIDNQKFPYYLLYVTPILSAGGAVWTYYSWQARSPARVVASLLLAGFLAANIGTCLAYIRRDALATEYRPAVAEIRRALGPRDIVMGPSELGFAFGFGRPLIDDCFLGFVSSIQPEVYVMSHFCGPSPDSSRPWDWSRETLAARYHEVFTNAAYTIYLRNRAAK